MTETEEVLALIRLKHRYCQLVDRERFAEVRELFTDTGSFRRAGQEPFVGEEGLTEFAEDVLKPTYEYTGHFVTNPIIDVTGDEAEGEWYILLFFEYTDGTVGLRHGFYTDEYRRVEGEWLIESSTVDFQATREFGKFTRP